METDDGTLHRLFRVEGLPTYYLIGKEGAIVSADLRPGDELTKEIEQQLK
jgi:hypothetical protein